MNFSVICSGGRRGLTLFFGAALLWAIARTNALLATVIFVAISIMIIQLSAYKRGKVLPLIFSQLCSMFYRAITIVCGAVWFSGIAPINAFLSLVIFVVTLIIAIYP